MSRNTLPLLIGYFEYRGGVNVMCVLNFEKCLTCRTYQISGAGTDEYDFCLVNRKRQASDGTTTTLSRAASRPPIPLRTIPSFLPPIAPLKLPPAPVPLISRLLSLNVVYSHHLTFPSETVPAG